VLNSVGKAYAFNACYAIACGIHYDIPLEKIVSALRTFSLYENRGSIHVFTKAIVYNHTYNFTSMAALSNLSDFATVNASTKIIILGPLLRETRDPQDKLYLSILRLALTLTPHVLVYGAPEFVKNTYPKGITICTDTDEFINYIVDIANSRFVHVYLHTSSILNMDFMPLFTLIEPVLKNVLN
jgi:UDP-N-acetylmuramyl pentapeptide synthase